MALKDIKLITRDRMGLFFICVFPILMGLFFGLVMGNPGSGSGGGKIKVAIVDQDDSETSRSFIESLTKIENLELESATREEAANSVRKGKRVGMIVLPEGFGERAGNFWGDPPDIEIARDPSRAAETAMLQGFIMQGMGELVGQRFQDPGSMRPMLQQAREDLDSSEQASSTQKMLVGGFLDSVESMIESASEVTGSGESIAGNNSGGMQFANIKIGDVSRNVDPKSMSAQLSKIRSQWDISFPQAMLWGVLSCVTGFSISIARERTMGTFTRLRVAPISKQSILAGKAMACFLTSLAVMAMMTVFGICLGMQPASYLKLFAASICVAIAFTGIMMVVSVLGKTEQSVSGAGMAIIMLLAMLGGCMIPAMFLPGFLQKISFLSPVRWAIQAIEGAIWREFSWSEMMMPLSVLIAFGVVFFLVGNQILKRQTA
jgi:ABC-2 type transport system permease protein